jgi:hypothetical protein
MAKLVRKINRAPVRTRVDKMITYRVASPRATHTRPASCAEVNCQDHARGWQAFVPAGSEQETTVRMIMSGALDGVRRLAGEEREAGGLIRFVFPAGQPCRWASTHRVSLNRPEFYTVRGGDWRGSTGLIRRHVGPRAGELWAEDSQDTFSRLKRQIEGVS